MTISDINQEIRDLCEGTSSTTLLDNATLLRRVNAAYEEIVGMILGVDGLWQFDDTNYTSFPIATTDLLVGQNDYTFASTHLEIEAVSVKNNNGNFQKLEQIDISEMDLDPSEFYKENGMPTYYDKQGSSLLLYPAPGGGDVTTAAGLKVFFKRTADKFTSAQVTTGTKEPGFAAPFHPIIIYKATLPYAIAYKPEIVPFLRTETQRLEKEIVKHYGRREQDRRKVMGMSDVSHI